MMNVEIGDKIGSGIYGTAYKAKYNDIECIYKVEKAVNSFSIETQFIRQGKFDDFAQKHPDHFMQLLSYGTIIDCDHKNDVPDDGSRNTRRMIEFYNKQKICRYYFYVPLMQGTLSEVADRLSHYEYTKMMVDILVSINLMGKNGWEHRDLHQDNIMYIMDASGYHWYLIDYGRIYNRGFERTDYDERISEIYISDLHTFLMNTIIKKDPVAELNKEKKKKWLPFDTALKLSKKVKNYGYIKQALVPVKSKVLKYEMLAVWIAANDYKLYAKIAGVEEFMADKKIDEYLVGGKLVYSSLISTAAKNLLKYDITPVVTEAKRLLKLGAPV